MPFFSGYLAQGVGPAASFVENTAAGYARVPIATTEIVNGGCSLAAPSYSQSQSPAVITQRGLYDAPTGGNLIMWWNLLNPVTLTSTSVDRIKAGTLSHTFPTLQAGQGTGAQGVDFLSGTRIGTTTDGNPITSGVAIEVKNGSVSALSLGSGSGSGSGGPGASTPRVITSGTTATLATADYVVGVNQASPAAITITMPAAPTAGYPYVISDYAGVAAANNITLVGNTGQTIRGSAVIATNGGARTLYWIPNLSAYVVAA